jgi:hypothetical protein
LYDLLNREVTEQAIFDLHKTIQAEVVEVTIEEIIKQSEDKEFSTSLENEQTN